MISIRTSGSFSKLENFLSKISRGEIFRELERYGLQGVDALSNATPVDTRLTAESWRYKIVHIRGKHSIEWYNTNVVDGKPVAILLQYGHGTGTGGWVEGRDYINPAIRPIFDQIANEVWEKVRHA